ncbi:protein tipE isoform X1 [Anabrus simplex]|uniref:protein tipE isoform X1 n=1 Tax=Anabrus simplex TaxID=316456 RepID=UPI0035A2EE72
MEEPEVIPQTLLEKLLFYTTAFFVLLGTFSLFAFLFLVPFVIDPAFTTIFMQFDVEPALCETMDVLTRKGASNCSWSSCREGCTKEVYECTQIRVNYKVAAQVAEEVVETDLEVELNERHLVLSGSSSSSSTVAPHPPPSSTKINSPLPSPTKSKRATTSIAVVETTSEHNNQLRNVTPTVTASVTRVKRALREYNYLDYTDLDKEDLIDGEEEEDEYEDALPEERYGLMGNDSEWYYTGAKLFPNVKGCGYPPMLNCSIFYKQYAVEGKNFSCYYSKIDPGLVITELDMHQVYMNLVYAMAIPIPSFIISVIYLTFAYFVIYNEEEEDPALVGADGDPDALETGENGVTPLPQQLTSGAITPGSEVFREDLASFGHQLKVAMADEMSRESIADAVPVSTSIPGNLSKTMTTSISTPAGPIAEV